MKIRNAVMGKIVGTIILLTALISWGCKDNKPLVYSTIYKAAEKGDLQDVKRHLNRGEAVNGEGTGWTPMEVAAYGGHKDVVELLRQHGGHE